VLLEPWWYLETSIHTPFPGHLFSFIDNKFLNCFSQNKICFTSNFWRLTLVGFTEPDLQMESMGRGCVSSGGEGWHPIGSQLSTSCYNDFSVEILERLRYLTDPHLQLSLEDSRCSFFNLSKELELVVFLTELR
jgi:hypothetical protein